jgi:hypothetical protein
LETGIPMALTVPASDPAPLAFNVQSRRHRRVRCGGMVRHAHLVSDPYEARLSIMVQE